jgi:ATP-binding cassette subfamily B (MDR/TAP) protein 1
MAVDTIVVLREESPSKKKVGILELFKYADWFDKLLIFIGTCFAMGNGSTLPLMTIFFGDVIQAVVTYPSTTSASELDRQVRLGVLQMCLVGSATFICSFVQMYCFVVSGERQSKRIREKYFRSVASQDVAWYDQHATGDLTNRLVSSRAGTTRNLKSRKISF